jgi:hypothetical protein
VNLAGCERPADLKRPSVQLERDGRRLREQWGKNEASNERSNDARKVWDFLTPLRGDTAIFREVADTIRRNPDLRTANKYLISWMAGLFARTAAVTCRALVDPDTRGYSLSSRSAAGNELTHRSGT